MLTCAPDSPSTNLRQDTRGAVMVLGVFMALGLIAGLWSMIGIGNALVYRNVAQTAADVSAFSATVHYARGMNLIAALNLVMIALVALYLIMRVVSWVLIIVGAILTPAYCAGCPLVTAGNQLNNVTDQYLRGISVVLRGLSFVQTATAMGSGALGEVIGIQNAKHSRTGKDHEGFLAVTVSPSLIPGNAGMGMGGGGGNNGNESNNKDAGGLANAGQAFGSAFGGGGGGGDDSKLGLPVVNKKFSVLCEKSAAMLLDSVGDLFGNTPGKEFISMVVGFAKDVVANGLKTLFCSSDSIWDADGPKTMFSKAKNGNDWMQTQAFVPTTMKDSTNHLLTLLPKTGRGSYSRTKSPNFTIYTAQAELFYDCAETWEHETCDDKPGNHYGISNTMVNMRWQTRLVRVRKTENSKMADLAMQVMQMQNFGDMLQQMGGSIGDIVGSLFGGGGGSFGNIAGQIAQGGQDPEGVNVGDVLFDAIFNNVDFGSAFGNGGGGGLFPRSVDGAEPGMYH